MHSLLFTRSRYAKEMPFRMLYSHKTEDVFVNDFVCRVSVSANLAVFKVSRDLTFLTALWEIKLQN